MPSQKELLGLFFFITGSVSAARIDIHFGRTKYNDVDIILRTFVEPLIRDILGHPEFSADGGCGAGEVTDIPTPTVTVRLYCRSTGAQLLTSLQDPVVEGLVFIGHPALAKEPKGSNQTAFLLGTDGRVISPDILLGRVGPPLGFLALLTCEGESIAENYQVPTEFSKTKIFKTARDPRSSRNGLLHLFLWQEPLLADIKEYLESRISKIPAEASKPAAVLSEVEITYRDLFSKTYGYSILIDGRLIGILEPATDRFDKQLNEITKTFKFETTESKPHQIQIHADFFNLRHVLAHRESGVVDDILIDRIEVRIEGQVLHTYPTRVHLGDDSRNADQFEMLTAKRNESDLEQTPLAPDLNWTFLP